MKEKTDYKQLTVGEYRQRLSLKNKHPSWANVHVRLFARSWNSTLRRTSCQVCNYSTHVELAHIKPISEFDDSAKMIDINSPDNILVLCRNHHWEFDNGVLTLSNIPARPNQQISATTENYIPNKAVNQRKLPKTKKCCLDCCKPISFASIRCPKCSMNHRGAIKRSTWPSKELLSVLVWETPASKLSEKFGVTDRTIKDWCDYYQISKPPRGFWS